MKKSLSILLIAALVVTAVMSMPLYPSAAGTGEDPGNVRSVAYGSCSTVNMLVYNDELFTTDPTVYDPQLAAMSIALASASCNSERVDESTKYTLMSRNAYQYLEDNGFSDIYVNDDYKVKPDGTKAPAIFAHKKIIDNGKEYTLLALVPKGGAMGAEFYPIAEAGYSGDFYYNSTLRKKVLQYARNYVRDHIRGDVKVWIPGYSRGGGVAALIAADIIDDPHKALGKYVDVSDSDVYCYCLSSYKTAENTRDLQADRYRGIHNIISESDIVVNLPWEEMSFGWLGDVRAVRSLADRKEALRLLSINSPGDYTSYENGSSDPDKFSPMKLDVEALLNGNLSVTPDADSYLSGYDQGQFIDAVMAPVIELFGEDAANARAGYYDNYQDAVTRMVKYYKQYDLPGASTLLESKTAIPFIMSAYVTSLFEARSKNNKINNEELNAAIIDAFNILAYFIEDKNGNIRLNMNSKEMETVKAAYTLIKTRYLDVNNNPATNDLGIPQKYSLKKQIKFDDEFYGFFIRQMRKITAEMYSRTLKDVLTAQGLDSETIRLMAEEDSAVMSAVITHVMFINDKQSGEIKPLCPENEQFNQLATIIGNFSRFDTLHYVEVDMSWIEGGSDLFSDFEGLTDDSFAGYRRVYITNAGQADVTGTVKDEKGNIVASFKNGRMLSRTDKWIGYTASDDGGWLRLPITHSYAVELKVSEDDVLGMKLAEYSVDEGKEVRSEAWKDLQAYANGSVVLSVPEIAAGESGYSLPSGVQYDVKVSGSKSGGDEPAPAEETVYSKSVPKAKSVKTKSGSKSMTVSWKKLKASDRRKFSTVEIQYSTSKKFKTYKTVDVSKNKKTVKIKGLNKGKTYYVRVRDVKKADGKRYVSKWSAKKKVRIK